jgi:hypothetical protein
MPDDWESDHGVYNPTADPDGDRLTNFQEFQNGTNPHNPDTDDDGMPDGWEVDNGLEPTFNDSDGDEDGDGLTNYEEFIYILISILKFFDSLN